LRNRIVKPKADISEAVTQALDALNAGQLVVYPTETFYALGADASSPRALERLFAIKRREPDKPVALIVADLAMARQVVAEIPASALRLAETFWPGPLTMVLPAVPGLNEALIGNDGGVGLRVSPHPIAHALVQRLGRPLTATSANLAGEPPADTVEKASAMFGDRVAIYLDGGRLGEMLASTVIAFERGVPCVLRPGPISESEITSALRKEIAP
jgi:L-threonylcarbamoyladenylate synthase